MALKNGNLEKYLEDHAWDEVLGDLMGFVQEKNKNISFFDTNMLKKVRKFEMSAGQGWVAIN